MEQQVAVAHADTGFNEDGHVEASYTPDMATIIEGEPERTEFDQSFTDASDALNVLLIWLAESATPHAAGLRVFCLLMLLRPELLGVRSATQLAKRLGVSKQGLAKYSSEVVRLCKNGFRRGAWTYSPEARESYRRRAIAVHLRSKSKKQP